MKVLAFNPGGESSNSYLLLEGKKAILVDAGTENPPKVGPFLHEEGIELSAVLDVDRGIAVRTFGGFHESGRSGLVVAGGESDERERKKRRQAQQCEKASVFFHISPLRCAG